ncbi:hypothetical protein [Corynebacterium aquilae]|nr:hypothetical protein [Corynebacterium aquilae]
MNAWIEALRDIPEGETFINCHRAMVNEYDRRKRLPETRAQANAVAAQYYEATEPKRKDGVVIWKKPPAAAFGYPTGYHVIHKRKEWENTAPEPTLAEPGDDSGTWIEVPKMEGEPVE